MTDKIKILTYKDPKKIEKREFYKDICKYPNLCASETLKMGLTNKKKGLNYGYICSIDSLVKELYRDWLDPVNQIKQMNSLTKYINNISNINLRKSFRFNKSEILNSLRFLLEMDVKPESINESNKVIRQFKSIYSQIVKEYEWKYLEETEKINQTSLKRSFENILDEEKKRYTKEEISLHINETNIKSSRFDKIVINGLHRFTPIIFRMIDDLIQQADVSIIFVINYLDEYPEIYKTWEEVYAWTGLPIKASNEKLVDRNNLGKSLGELLNGNIKKFSNNNIQFIKYDNISSFADKVSNSYKATINRDDKVGQLKTVGNISKMKEQFYSAKMEDINNLLKQYHPVQFGDKHFLAYPIGQFILSIYNMWDNDEKKLLIDSKSLKQCLSLGFFNTNKYNCLDIYNRLESYYLNLKIRENHSIKELRNNIEILKRQILELDEAEIKKRSSTTLRRFSFYNISIDELEHFNKKVGIIDDIGNEIFKDTNGRINFYKHYRDLINVIKSNIDIENLTKKEKEMIEELDNRFKKLESVEVEGDIDNVRDSLHFYLNRIEDIEANEHQASWIVRNLEHLDGGVLLEGKGNKTYHLCLIGDIDMNAPVKEILPYPLTIKFFNELNTPKKTNQLENRHLSIMKSYQERPNFLRYCFFYGTFFLNSKMVVSYIKNYHEDVNLPYYLLRMLGIEFEDESQGIHELKLKSIGTNTNVVYKNSLKNPIQEDEVKNFLYCEYKYFLEDVLEGDTFFYNEFSQKKYYETLLLYASVNRIKNGDKNTTENIVESQNERFKNNFFPIWKEAIFKDAYKKIVGTINSKDRDDILNNETFDEDYFNLRKKFIYARLTDKENEEKNLISNLHHINNRRFMIYKRQISQKLMDSTPLIRADSSEKCKYCGVSGICLERYRDL